MKKTLLLLFALLTGVNASRAQYCASAATDLVYGYMSNVTFAGINHNSGSTGYSDFTAVSGQVVAGLSYPISATVEVAPPGPYEEYITVYIDWNQDFTFDQTERYDVGVSLVVGTFVVTGNIAVPANALPGTTRMRIKDQWDNYSVNPCGTYTYGEVEDYTLTVLPASGRDAGINSLVQPAILQIGQNIVSIRIQNLAADLISSVDVTYQLDNNTPVSVSAAQLPSPLMSGATHDYQFAAPLNITTPGSYTLKTWIANANGLGNDNNLLNDTLTTLLCTGLSGTYTVGGTNPDYASIAAAVHDLNQCGLSGAVSFQVAPGTYYGSYQLLDVPGISAANTISFNSTGGPATTILIHDTVGTNSAVNRITFNISNTPFVTINGFTFRKLVIGTTVSPTIVINNASDVTVLGNIFEDLTGGSSTNAYGIRSNSSNNTIIANNTFINHYYPVYVNGTNASPVFYSVGLSVVGNTFNTYRYGIYIDNCDQPLIQGNILTGLATAATSGYGIYLSRCQQATVSENRITGKLGNAGIYLSNMNGTAQTSNRVYNNLVSGMANASSSIVSYGIYFTASYAAAATPENPRDFVEIVHNTINMVMSSTATSTYSALYVTGGSLATPAIGQLTVLNNIVFSKWSSANIGSGYKVVYYPGSWVVDSLISDHNNFRMETSTGSLPTNSLIRVNNPLMDYLSLSDWATATGKDTNSVSISPDFISFAQPEPTSLAMDNLGTVVSYVTSDIAGLSRHASTPDMGAYEFTGAPFSQIISTPLQDTLLSVSRLFAVTLLDTNTGITVGPPNSPRLYYRKHGQTSWQTDSVPSVSGSEFTFNINYASLGGVVALDTIEYYVACRNNGGTVTTSPLGGAGQSPIGNTAPPSLHMYKLLGQASGNYNVGVSSAADFPTITSAINFLNNSIITTPVTFTLIDTLYNTGETFPIEIERNSGSGVNRHVVIKPAASATQVLITGLAPGSTGLFVLNQVANFEFNGANGSGTPVLTIQSTSQTTNSAVIWLRGPDASSPLTVGNDSILIRNLKVIGGSNTANTFYGIHAGGNTILSNGAGNYMREITIENVSVERAGTGIHVRGTANYPASRVNLKNNKIGSLDTAYFVTSKGIDVIYTDYLHISDNEIFNLAGGNIGANIVGIEGAGIPGARIERNKIRSIKNAHPDGWSAFGINLSVSPGFFGIGAIPTGDSIWLVNNVVHDIKTVHYLNTSTDYNAFGIRIAGGAGHRLYYNSVSMTGSDSAISSSSALLVSSAATTGLDIRNNIFANAHHTPDTSVRRYFTAVWFNASFNFSGCTINNNAYHVDTLSGFHFVGRKGATTAAADFFTTLADWKVITQSGNPANDGLSIPTLGNSVAPFTSPLNLTIPNGTTTGIESGGVVIAALGIPNTDINGTTRPGGGTATSPDMGAYEISGVALPDDFAPSLDSVHFTPATSQCTPVSRTVTAFVSDNLGGKGVDSVRLLYSFNGVAQTPVNMTLASGTVMSGSWTGTIPAASGSAVLVETWIVARDSVANISSAFTADSFKDDYLIVDAGPDQTIITGSQAILIGNGGNVLVTLGNGNLVNSGTSFPAPYGGYWYSARHQFLMTAGELYGLGVSSGAINSLAFDVSATGGNPLQFFTIKMGHTTQTEMASWESTTTQVYTDSAYLATSTGWNTHTFQTPFMWNGVDNVVIEVCFDNGLAYSTNAIVNQSTTSFASSIWYTAAGACGSTAVTNGGQQRPNMRLNASRYVSWRALGSSVILSTSDTLVVSPTATTRYIFTVTDSICFKSDTVTVTVNALSPDGCIPRIVSPLPGAVTALNQAYPVTVTIKNCGPVSISGFDVAYTVNGGASVSTNSITATIAPGDSIQHTFTQHWTPSVGGSLKLCAFITSLAGGVNPANDTACVTHENVGTELPSNSLVNRVYPNPASTQVRFELKGAAVRGTSILLFDQLGREVNRTAVAEGTSLIEMNTSQLADGLYHYRIQTPVHTDFGKLFIRSK